MTDKNGDGGYVPSYLDALRRNAGRIPRGTLSDWGDDFGRVCALLMGDDESQGGDQGTSLTLSCDSCGLLCVVRTTRYGYEARYHGKTMGEVLESLENDLDLGTVPWQEDWRRRKESSKRIELG